MLPHARIDVVHDGQGQLPDAPPKNSKTPGTGRYFRECGITAVKGARITLLTCKRGLQTCGGSRAQPRHSHSGSRDIMN
jgi:hypothetical protein